jgi:CRISPR type IV-associated protein Csf3
MTADHLMVTCFLAAPLAGAAPQLDGLLEWAMSIHNHNGNHERWKVDRRFAAPALESIAIPIAREKIGGWPVACSSSPIVPRADSTTVEYVTKKLAVEHADLLAPEERKQVSTTGSWTKSYRLPLDVRRVDKVVWFAKGNRAGLIRALKQVRAIGQRTAKGFGVVHRWEVDKNVEPHWWYSRHATGTVLMRPLPVCEELPRDLVGYKRTFGACCPPYWHAQDRYCEIVEPV